MNEVMQVLTAVAALDTVPLGPNEDGFCPFPECGRDELLQRAHDENCPIAIARRVIDAQPYAVGSESQPSGAAYVSNSSPSSQVSDSPGTPVSTG